MSRTGDAFPRGYLLPGPQTPKALADLLPHRRPVQPRPRTDYLVVGRRNQDESIRGGGKIAAEVEGAAVSPSAGAPPNIMASPTSLLGEHLAFDHPRQLARLVCLRRFRLWKQPPPRLGLTAVQPRDRIFKLTSPNRRRPDQSKGFCAGAPPQAGTAAWAPPKFASARLLTCFLRGSASSSNGWNGP